MKKYIKYDYWVEMALCGEGIHSSGGSFIGYNYEVYFKSTPFGIIRISFYRDYDGSVEGYSEVVPFVGY